MKTASLLFCVLFLALTALAQEPPKPTPEQEKQVAQAREILEQARKATFALPVEQEGRATLLQGIAKAYAEVGDVDSALLAIDALGEDYNRFKGNILTVVAAYQARSGDVDGALRTLDSAEDQGGKSFGMLMVVVRLGKQGYWGPARQLADKIEEEDVRGKALVLLAQDQVARGDATGARLTAEAIPDEAQREKTLRNIERMEALIAAGGKVETIDTAFPAATLGSPRVRPETAPFQLQLPSTGLLVAGDNSADPVVNRVRELVEAAVEVKDQAAKKAAIEQLQQAAELAASIRSPSDRADQLYLVAVAQSELGDFQRARKTAAQLDGQMGGEGLGSLIHLYTVRSVASAQAASGGVDDALAWTESEANPTLRAAVLLGAAEGILRRLEVEKWPANLPRPPQ